MERFLYQIKDDYNDETHLVTMSCEQAKAIEWLIDTFSFEIELDLIKKCDIEHL